MPGFSYPGTPGVVANEGRLFEPYRQIVPRKICRLAEPITVIAVACDVEFDAADFSEFGKIPFLPVDDGTFVIGDFKSRLYGGNFGAVFVESDRHQSDETVRSDRIGEPIAAYHTVEQIGRGGHIHVVDHAGYAVLEPDGLKLRPAVAGIVPIAIMYAEIPGTVVSSESGFGMFVINSQLMLKIAAVYILFHIVGDGLAAAPKLMIAPFVGEPMRDFRISLIVPVVNIARRRVEQRSAVLGRIDQRRPVIESLRPRK